MTEEYDKCPHCGYVPIVTTLFYVEGDLLTCNKCNGRIDVVRKNETLIFTKSTDVTFGID